ncbi:MAG: hypothetical protein GY913_19130 [Proteobacteria bacterium]|nr:hypothetical protein [Pseudomonadota bacterium]MCP4919023.1 hypothetical protein [Pseudomonadota bacterium]
MLLSLLVTACTPPPGSTVPSAAGAVDSVELVPGVTADPSDPSDAVFDDTRVVDIRLSMTDEVWDDVSENPWEERWHEARFEWNGEWDGEGDGEVVESVGLRAFGYGSLIAGKPPLKIDFNREVEGQRWRGLEVLKLRNSTYDPSFIRDALATRLLLQAGVPASRTGWARVWANGELVGLYTVMESIDDRFLERHFGNDDGPMYTINDIRGHGLMPLTDPLTYFEYETEVTGDGSDLVDLTRIVAEGSDEELAAVLDVDGFWLESIVRSISGSPDSFSADGNNFYLYNDPAEDADPTDLHGTWRIIPWDYNLDFSWLGLHDALLVDPARPWATTPFAQDPYTGEPYVDVLLERQLATRGSVDDTVAELVTGPLPYPELAETIELWRGLLAADVANDPLGDAASFDRTLDDTLLYLHMRWSNAVGWDVAECAALEDDAVLVREMAPSGSVGWATPTLDGWWWQGAPQRCINSDGDCFGLRVSETHYCTGLYAHAPSDMTITVPEGMTTLRGAVGLQLFGQDCSTGASFSVVQDGQVLWESGVLTSYADAEVMGDVPVSPGELSLLTHDLGNLSCDTTSWLDLRAVP